MAYELEVYPDTRDQIAALPAKVLPILADVMAMLELTPWSGDSLNKDKPAAPVRTLPFGRFGMITYLILEDQRRVDLLNVVWVGATQ